MVGKMEGGEGRSQGLLHYRRSFMVQGNGDLSVCTHATRQYPRYLYQFPLRSIHNVGCVSEVGH